MIIPIIIKYGLSKELIQIAPLSRQPTVNAAFPNLNTRTTHTFAMSQHRQQRDPPVAPPPKTSPQRTIDSTLHTPNNTQQYFYTLIMTAPDSTDGNR